MEVEKLKKTTIERLKKVKAENGLSISKIMELLEKVILLNILQYQKIQFYII